MTPVLCDTATKFTAGHRGAVVVCGSHGGLYPAQLAAKAGVRAIVLSDAGIGLDGGGIASLAYGLALGMAVATVAHDSARIGDASDMMARGVVSRVNAVARSVGCHPGMSCAAAAHHLADAPTAMPPPYATPEGRSVVPGPDGGPALVLVDSAALIRQEDAGQIVITGSHGGVVGNNPATALRVDALAAGFHDAGVGIDMAGISRLFALDMRSIIAFAVAAASARIGDAESVLETGCVSHVNRCAQAAGLRAGMSTREAVALLQETAAARAIHRDTGHG